MSIFTQGQTAQTGTWKPASPEDLRPSLSACAGSAKPWLGLQVSAALAIIASAHGLVVLVAGITVLGLGMGMYEAPFANLVGLYGDGAPADHGVGALGDRGLIGRLPVHVRHDLWPRPAPRGGAGEARRRAGR